MKALLRIGTFALFGAWSNVGFAYCPGADPTVSGSRPDYYSVRQEFARAKFVAEVTAEREIWLGDDGKPKPLQPPYHFGGDRPSSGIFDPYLGAYFDVRVRRSFKGNPPSRLRLFSSNTTGRFFLTKGQSYVLFVTTGKFDPPIGRSWTVDNCGNSDSTSKRSLFRQVERLSRR